MNFIVIIVICILIIFLVFGIYKYLEETKSKVSEELENEKLNSLSENTSEAAQKAAKEAADREEKAKFASEEATRIASKTNATEEEKKKAQELVEALAAAERETVAKKTAAAVAEKKLAEEIATKAAADAAAAEEARKKAVDEAAAKEAAAKAAQEAATKATTEAERKRLETEAAAAVEAARKAVEAKVYAEAEAARKAAEAKAKADAEAAAIAAALKASEEKAEREAKAAAEAAKKAEEARRVEEEAKLLNDTKAAAEAEAARKTAEEKARAEAEAAAKAAAEAKATAEEAARIAAANSKKYWVSSATLTTLSKEVLGDISSPYFGIGSIYKPGSTFVQAGLPAEANIIFNAVNYQGLTGKVPLLKVNFSNNNINPMTTTHLVIVKPKNLSFDHTLGSLLLQNLKVFDNMGNNISNSLRLLKTANDIIAAPGDYQPDFVKAVKKKEDTESTPEWAGIFSVETLNSVTGSIPALDETTGIFHLAPIVSQGSVSDSIILTVPNNVIISSVLFEYSFPKFFNGLSGISSIFDHNIKAWINYCMANTMVVLLNATGNVEKPVTIIAHRTLGALKETPVGFRKTLYFPVRLNESTGIAVFNADITGTTFVTTESYIAPKLEQFSEFKNFLSPLDALNPTKPSPMVTTVPNPDVNSELLRETRYPQYNPKSQFHPSSYVQSTSPKIIIGDSPVWATKASDFVSLPQCNNTGAVFSVGSIRVDSTKAHGVVVKQVPAYFRIIRKWYKMLNSPDVKNSSPLTLDIKNYTTSTPNAQYNSAEKFQALEDELHPIKTVTGGVEYVILENSYQVSRPPEFSASYPPEPIHVVIYTADMEEIASFQAVEFNSIRVYVENP